MTEIHSSAAGDLSPAAIASYIDHTVLKPETTRAQIETLCQEALENRFAAVCVNPCWVRLASGILTGSTVKVATVVGFPLGATPMDVKAYETRRAIWDGAQEIDMVLNIGALKSGDLELVERDIRAVVEASVEGGAHVKVILETCLLTREEKVAACHACVSAGAHFVKTSTGFSSGGATVEDVALMRETVGVGLGVKASGGVRSYADAVAMIRAGANRIGTSSGVAIIQGK